MTFTNALAALAGVVGAIIAIVIVRRRPAIRPDDAKARAEEDAKVKAADKARDEQKRQPLADWINGRFGRKP